MKVSALQFDIAFRNQEKNEKKVTEMIEQAVNREQPDVIVLPEMWNVSFFPDNVFKLADEEGKSTKKLLSHLAKKYDINIVGGSVAAKKKEELYNTSYCFNRNGKLIHEYNKVHLFSPSQENESFSPGDKVGIFEIDGIKVGVATCYDLRFVEWIRKMALQDIEVLFVPAAWPHPRVFPWQTLLRARAIENQVFVVGVNSIGEADKLSFCGHSMILNPLGETLIEAEEQERILSAELNLESRDEIKKQINVFNDRRPELYN